ncbi:MAG: DUF5953 family protein [Cystobacter sp.]
MKISRTSILLGVYAPELENEDERLLSLAGNAGSMPPGLRLAWSVSHEGRFLPSPQREAWLKGEPAHEDPENPHDEGAGHLVTLIGWERPAALSPAGRAQFEIHAKWPLGALEGAAAAELLERVSEGVRAYWAHATPNDLVAGMEPRAQDNRSPVIPRHLGWLNYWSAAAARALGFPDPSRDADLLSRARRTASGGWVVQLTQEPLDLDDPSHVDALLRGYKRFPEMGGAPADRTLKGVS